MQRCIAAGPKTCRQSYRDGPCQAGTPICSTTMRPGESGQRSVPTRKDSLSCNAGLIRAIVFPQYLAGQMSGNTLVRTNDDKTTRDSRPVHRHRHPARCTATRGDDGIRQGHGFD
jgi:hypothetical protein